jgi:hypothetical protein
MTASARGRIWAATGAAAALAGAILIGGPAQADAAGQNGHVQLVAGSATALSCAHQPNLDNPTNSTNQALTTYYFDVTDAGVTNSYCRLGFHISAGDTITVHFTPLDPGNPPQVTLAMYKAPGLHPHQQTLTTCASNQVSPLCGAAQTGDELTVRAPYCGFQVDFIYGNAIKFLTQGTYRTDHRLINGRTGSLSSTGCQ